MRPPIERYVRCSVTHGDWTCEPGVEWRDGDNELAMVRDLEVIACGVAEIAAHPAGPMAAAKRAEPQFARWWLDRAFFIELHDTRGRWVQIFQPYGVPRNL